MEVLLFILLLLASVIFYLSRKNKNDFENDSVTYALLSVLILIAIFLGIHLAFYYRIGFPASKNQSESDLVLRSADWLSFLGNYLSFSGSLVMAYIVYRQSKAIDELTISEYKPSINITIRACIKSAEYKKGLFKENNILQVLPNDSEPFYTYHCDLLENDKQPLENYSILLFVEIHNYSKSTINQLSFKHIVFTSLDLSDKCQYEYKNRGGDWDPADKLSQILPGKMLKRCFLINKIPEDLGIRWMTITFHDAENQILEQRFLVSKAKGGMLIFLNVTDPC